MDRRAVHAPRRSLAWNVLDRIADHVFSSPWPAAIAYRVGLQRHVAVSTHIISIPSKTLAVPSLRLAFASDFHAGPFTHESLWKSACDKLEQANPDLLLLGGDFVSVHARHLNDLARRLGEITAPLGRFAVLGNHDIWAGRSEISGTLEKHGINVITNANVRLPPPFEAFFVCGIDDHIAGNPDSETTFAGAEGYRLLLMHAPSCLLDVLGHTFHLALCGHTHGGQVSLPGGTPIFLPKGKLSRRYARGNHVLCTDSGRVLLVSLGVGCSMVPVRLFCPPEVHVITLRCGTP